MDGDFVFFVEDEVSFFEVVGYFWIDFGDVICVFCVCLLLMLLEMFGFFVEFENLLEEFNV